MPDTNIILDEKAGKNYTDTVTALNEYHEMKENPKKYKRYSTFKEAMDEVLSN